MLKVTTILCLTLSIGFLSGCTSPEALKGLPGSTFEAVPAYEGEIKTIGHLAEAHVTNTFALHQANNKLGTICVAANRCKEVSSDEE